MKHSSRRGVARFGTATVAVLATGAMVGLAGPAHAAAPDADLSVGLSGSDVVRQAAKYFYVDVANHGPDTAQAVTVKIDASGIDPRKLFVELPGTPDCEVEGTASTCTIGTLAAGGNDGSIGILVGALRRGHAGSLTLTVSSATPDSKAANNTKRVKIDVEPSGLDLVTRAFDVYENLDKDPVKPGGTGVLDVYFENASSFGLAVKGIRFTVELPDYVTFADKREGCTYSNSDRTAECTDPDIIIPSTSQQGDNPPQLGFLPDGFEVKLAANAPGPGALTGGVVSGYGLRTIKDEELSGLTASNVGMLGKVGPPRSKKDADRKDNKAKFSVFTAANPADLSVTTQAVSGAVGSTVSVPVQGKNAGPADSPMTEVVFVAPTGTELVDETIHSACIEVTADKEYRCTIGTVFAGDEINASVTFTIASAAIGSDGKVSVSGAVTDPNPANNSAPITITAPGSPGTDPGSPGGLPVTGAQIGIIGIVGVVVVALGGLLLVLSRRRRVIAVAPADESTSD